MPSTTYMIFARKEYQQPLELIGRLTLDGSPAPEAARAELDRRAREPFGIGWWVEMVAIPEADILRVIPMEQT